MNQGIPKTVADLAMMGRGGNQHTTMGTSGEPDRNYRFQDMFFENAHHVRSLALSTLKKEHDNPINDSNPRYPGIRSKVDPVLQLKIKTELELGLLLEINQFEAWYHLTPGIHGEGLYHNDTFQLSGMIYLNDKNPIPDESGTYIGKRLHESKMGKPYADACSSHDEEVITAFNTIKEEYNRTNFETVHVIHNYYNRLIAYEGRTPHRAGCYFGTDFEDSRLTLTFFYDTK